MVLPFFLQSFLFGGLVIGFVGAPLLSHALLKNYVAELTYEQDSKVFEATTYSWNFYALKKKKWQFR